MEQLMGTVSGKEMLVVLISAWPSALVIKTYWCGVGKGDVSHGVGGGEMLPAIVDDDAVVILVIRCG